MSNVGKHEAATVWVVHWRRRWQNSSAMGTIAGLNVVPGGAPHTFFHEFPAGHGNEVAPLPLANF